MDKYIYMYIFVILATNIYIYMCVVETLIESMIIYYGYYNENIMMQELR